MKYVKDNLFEIPPVFNLIQSSSGVSWEEMYQVFNMGHRMEIILPKQYSQEIIDISKKYNVPAKIIGYVQKSPQPNDFNTLILKTSKGNFQY